MKIEVQKPKRKSKTGILDVIEACSKYGVSSFTSPSGYRIEFGEKKAQTTVQQHGLGDALPSNSVAERILGEISEEEELEDILNDALINNPSKYDELVTEISNKRS